MTSTNPYRDFTESPYTVDGGSGNLVVDGVYGVDDVVYGKSTTSDRGDPRIFVSIGGQRSKLTWNRINRQGWVSPKAKQSNDKDVVLQIKFNRPRRFNYLSFELLRVPQVWEVRYYDSARKRMVSLTDREGHKIDGSISGFKVNVLDPKGEKNTSHKWRKYDFRLPNITTNIIEIRMNREVDNPPILNLNDFYGIPIDTPYSVGLRNVKIKMRIRKDDDVDDDDDDGIPNPIGTTERPVVKRHTSLLAHDEAGTTYWECAPQGASSSVVPFYLDTRQADGSASLYDSLKLVPLWTGPSMSVYWSNDETVGPWTVSANRYQVRQVSAVETTLVRGSGLLVESADQGGKIPNELIRADLNKDFMVGLEWTPTADSAADRYMWSFVDSSSNEIGLKFDPTASGGGGMTGNFKIVENGNTLYTSNSYTITNDETYGVVLGYIWDDSVPSTPRGWYLKITDQEVDYSAGTGPTGMFPLQFYIGNWEALNSPAQGYIKRLWIRQDKFSRAVANAFLTNSESFSKGEGGIEQRVNGLYNALLVVKFNRNLEARVGPGPGFFREKVWTPVPIDYSLSTSRYDMPLVSAKYLKLEFSNLVPRTYLTQAETLPVRRFPQWLVDWYRAIWTAGPAGSPYQLGYVTNPFEGVPPTQAPGGGDSRRMSDVRTVLEGGGGSGVPPVIYHGSQSTAEYAINPGSYDPTTSYNELQFASVPMRFFRTMRHEYELHEVEVQRRAFFVGIKELALFRRDHSVQFDTPEYTETYDDGEYISSNIGFINTGSTYSSTNPGDSITSVAFPSFSNFVTAQVAVLDSGWETFLTDSQINLGGLTHLEDPQGDTFDGSHNTATTHYDVVTPNYVGARGGNVVEVTRATGSTEDAYGVRTGVLTPLSYGEGRVSGVVRMQLPETNEGDYEIRIWARSGTHLITGTVVRSWGQPGVAPEGDPSTLRFHPGQEAEIADINAAGPVTWKAYRPDGPEDALPMPDVHDVELAAPRPDGPESEMLALDIAPEGDPSKQYSTPVGPQVEMYGSDSGDPDDPSGSGGQDVNTQQGNYTLAGLDDPTPLDQDVLTQQGVTSYGLTQDGDPSPFDQDVLAQQGVADYASSEVDGPSPFDQDVLSQYGVYSLENAGDSSPLDQDAPEFYGGINLSFTGELAEPRLLVSKKIKIPVRSWKEIEVSCVAPAGETELVVEVVQVKAGVTEPMVIDMLGVWQNPIKWEISNDGGANWQPVQWPLNNPDGYVRFPFESNRLMMKATALRANAVISGWAVVPWYLESSMVVRAPIDYMPPWHYSDEQDLRDTSHKPIFQVWNHWFPQRFSINLLGYLP